MEEAIQSKLDVEDKRNHFLNADEQVFHHTLLNLLTRNADKILLFQLHFLRA